MSEVILMKNNSTGNNKISNEIIENNKDSKDLAIVGIHNKGVFIAKRILK